MTKKIVILMMVFIIASLAGACAGAEGLSPPSDGGGQPGAEGPPVKVGVLMPTQSLQRWNQDGDNMKMLLEAAGYEVDLKYAGDNEIPLQITQIEDMISGGCKILVIAAIDGNQLSSPLRQAKDAGIPVIAYDRLIMNSDAVSYYATFDNFKVGEFQGQFIVDELGFERRDGPINVETYTDDPNVTITVDRRDMAFNIEFFTGDPGDNNINFFFGGAMSKLRPYIDSGHLIVPSGQTSITQCAIESWNSEKSQARMENLISSQGYGPNGRKLDAVLSSNDSVAQGITAALVGAGYTKDNFPILTGQDCDVASMKNMFLDLQSMSIFKDTRTLAARVVTMVDDILKGAEPELNDYESYENGTGVIPAYLCDPVVCTPANYKALLIDSGYYTEDQIQP